MIPEVDFELDSYELVLLRQTARLAETEPAEAERLLGEHVAYLLGLKASGELLAAGAVTDAPDEAEPVSGFGLFRTGDLATTRALVAQDPAIVAGIERADVMAFHTPKGSLRFDA